MAVGPGMCGIRRYRYSPEPTRWETADLSSLDQCVRTCAPFVFEGNQRVAGTRRVRMMPCMQRAVTARPTEYSNVRSCPLASIDPGTLLHVYRMDFG